MPTDKTNLNKKSTNLNINPLSANKGFSLMEVLVVMAIIGIIAGFAYPSLTGVVLNSRRTTALNDIIRLNKLAKNNALKQGARVAWCPSNNTFTTCNAASNDYGSSSMLFFDNNQNGRFDSANDTLITTFQIGTGATLKSPLNYFVFYSGIRQGTNGTLTYCDSRGISEARNIIISPQGLARITNKTAQGAAISSCDP